MILEHRILQSKERSILVTTQRVSNLLSVPTGHGSKVRGSSSSPLECVCVCVCARIRDRGREKQNAHESVCLPSWQLALDLPDFTQVASMPGSSIGLKCSFSASRAEPGNSSLTFRTQPALPRKTTRLSESDLSRTEASPAPASV